MRKGKGMGRKGMGGKGMGGKGMGRGMGRMGGRG